MESEIRYIFTVETTITDPSWLEEYLEKVPPIMAKYEGTYFTSTENVEIFEGEGEVPHSFVIAEFPSKSDALSFYNSPEYAPYKAARLAGSHCKTYLMPVRDA